MSTARSATNLGIFAKRTNNNDGASPDVIRMAETFCDDLGKKLSDMLPGATAALCGVSKGAIADHVANRDEFGVVLVARSLHAPGAVLFQMPASAIDAWLNRLLGGSASSTGPRPVSPIDAQLCRLLLDLALRTFPKINSIELGLEVEAVVTAASKISALRQMSDVTAIEIAIGSQTAPARFKILIPAPIATMISTALQDNSAERDAPPVDQTWTAQIERHIAKTKVPLEAILNVSTIDLASVAGWHVGQLLPLPVKRNSPILLQSEGVTLAHCDIGRNGDRLVLRIAEARNGDDTNQNHLEGMPVSPEQA